MKKDNKDIVIQVTTYGVNSGDIEDLNEFIEKLDSIYTVERKDEPCAACGGASDLGILLNIGSFISGSIASGIVWDLTKGVLPKWYESLRMLKKKNDNLTVYLTMDFGDYLLHINEAMTQSFSSLGELFCDIEDNVLFLESRGYSDITSITMPFIETDDNLNRFVLKEPYAEFDDYWWEVTYGKDQQSFYFNPKTREVFIRYK